MHISAEYDQALENSVKNKVDWYQRMQEGKAKEEQTLISQMIKIQLRSHKGLFVCEKQT
jgi:hypothetical protein